MQCLHCAFESPEGMKFCGRCGKPLTPRCPGCGSENPSDFSFCGQCGAALSVFPKEPDDLDAERRHLTVMFCNQVDLVNRSQRIDPEELREVTQHYQEMCAQIIRTFDGQIGQHQGDGLLVYFGYPRAHEDDAQRAVRAGLSILAEIPHLNARLQQTLQDLRDFPLQIRIGIHTGLAVVGKMGADTRREVLALGEAPNTASRLQSLATPNTMLMSEETYRLTAGSFACQDLGLQQLKGLSSPVRVYQPLQESSAHVIEVREAAGLTPFVGRKEELGLLLQRWAQVKEGEGRIVLLSGEAGIGKSRLLRELKERLAGEKYERLECRCSPYYQNSAFYSVVGLLQRLLDFQRDDSPQEQLRKLEAALEQAGFALPEIVPLFAALLSLPLSASRFSPPVLTPQRQRQKILEASLAWLLRLAQQQPVLLVVEDLQWIDPSTLELLNLFIDLGPGARILTLLTFRPDLFSPLWTTRSHVIRLALSRLPRKQAELMVEKVAGGKTLPTEVLRQLVDNTDGVPLFVEELTKMVLESGVLRERERHYEFVGPLPPLAIPATLHDSLMARLDRLGAVKETAQLAATLGREFTYELIHAIAPVDEAALQQDLARLAEAELLYQRGLPPQARYMFKHALIQEAAYQSLLKSKRQQSHQQIAQVLEERFPVIKETQPELLAHHYTQAGLIPQAIPFWQRAGQRAVERSANVEAISHLTRGLECLQGLPHDADRMQYELALRITLGPALMASKGYGAPEVAEAYARARALCQQVPESPQLLPVLFGLWGFHLVRGNLRTARELGEQILSLAPRVRDSGVLVEAHGAVGVTLFYLGELVSARAQLTQSMALYDAHKHRSLAVLYGQDPWVACRSTLAQALWLLGYPDQALQTSYEALGLAQELSHPFTLAFAQFGVSLVHQFRHEGQAAQKQAEASIALCSEQGFPFWASGATLLKGWALAEQGQEEEGLSLMRQGLTARRAIGSELGLPMFLASLAWTQGNTGQAEEGLALIAEALAVVDHTEERRFEAELYRLKGQLTLQLETRDWRLETSSLSPQASSLKPQASRGVVREAEECFLKAIEIARRQSAKSLELRAVVSLSQLWQQQGKTAEARPMLAEIYGWFTEGFDTPDLREAKALLERLS